jgi:Skp family chaperone for outer membrane proteins
MAFARALWVGLLALLLALPAAAQDSSGGLVSPILTLDQDRVYTGSLWGARAAARISAALETLAAENSRIADELTEEERSLTERRADMAPEAFRAEADAFDARVVTIRREQDAKSRDIARSAEAEQRAFYQAILPVLGEVMRARGALAILDRNAIFVSADIIDVTDEVIALADAQLGAGPQAPQAPAPDSAGGNGN